MCGPNSLARVLAHAKLYEGSGNDVRRRVIAHAKKLVRARAVWEPAQCQDEEGYSEDGSVRDLIEDSFATWARPGRSSFVGGQIDPGGGNRHVISAERWLRHMASPTAWVDQAFLALAADFFAVEILYYEVSGTGATADQKHRVVKPRQSVGVRARVELAYVLKKHFCAILPSEAGAGGSFIY